jgi:hypothetical protein
VNSFIIASNSNPLLDGTRKIIVEHYLNMLLLPGLHVDSDSHVRFQPSDSQKPSDSPLEAPHHPTFPSLAVPGTSLSFPSPFHFRLHIITRLSFNEQGKVTHHVCVAFFLLHWLTRFKQSEISGTSKTSWVSSQVFH